MIRNVTDPRLSINISNRKELKLLTRVSKSTKNLTELRYILTKLEPSRKCVNKQMDWTDFAFFKYPWYSSFNKVIPLCLSSHVFKL